MKKTVLYSKKTCPFCLRAMALLDKKNVTYEVIDLLDNPERRDEMIAKANGRTTVPQIFMGDQHIGGCDDLFALEQKGKLDSLL